ncbi:MAG TPA: spore coat protein [Tissierellaceae bacterium]|nr:spore coat protein [Tissierellaceae bacterium]
MREQDIVNDVLEGTKASINSYTHAIMEASNQQLRTTLQTLRDEAEQIQYQIYQIAEQKGYYTPAPTASTNDIAEIKTSLKSSLGSNTQNPMQ